MTYLEKLVLTENYHLRSIDELAQAHQVQFVGSGYVELIIPLKEVNKFIDGLTERGIVVNFLDWWCHCTPENENKYGCPHGLGGPSSLYSNGWFSETQIQAWEFSEEALNTFNKSPTAERIRAINNEALAAVSSIDQNEHYTPCLVPALGLFVPEHWRNSGDISESSTDNF